MMKKVINRCWQRKRRLLGQCWKILPVVSVLSLTACSAVPFKIVPKDANTPAPVCPYQSLTIGSIQAGNYNAPEGIGTVHPGYAVAVPKTVMMEDSACRAISDGEDVDGRYVTFGPTAEDRTTYRLHVSALAAKDHPFFSFSEKAMAESVQKMVNHYHAPATKLYERYYVYHGHSTRFAVYQQTLNGQGGRGAIAKGGETLTQAVYVIKQRQHYAVLWVTASSRSKANWVNGSNRMAVIQHRWTPLQTFLDSFTMTGETHHDYSAAPVHHAASPTSHPHVQMNMEATTAPPPASSAPVSSAQASAAMPNSSSNSADNSSTALVTTATDSQGSQSILLN